MSKVRMRKPLHDKAMVRYSTRLRPDQVEVLKHTGNVAELIRSWVDKGLEDILGDREPILIQRKITVLEGQITKLQNAYDYVRAKGIAEGDIQWYSDAMKALDNEDTFMTLNWRTLVLWPDHNPRNCIDVLSDRIYCSGWPRPDDLRQYLKDHQVINAGNALANEIVIPKEHAQAILVLAIEAYPSEVKVLEPYDAEIAKLEAERQKLMQRLAEVQQIRPPITTTTI